MSPARTKDPTHNTAFPRSTRRDFRLPSGGTEHW